MASSKGRNKESKGRIKKQPHYLLKTDQIKIGSCAKHVPSKLGLVLTSAKFIPLADAQCEKNIRSMRCELVRVLFRQGGRT